MFWEDIIVWFDLVQQQGVLGIKVKIMLDWDPKGKQGPMTPLPDLVTIHTPKEELYTPAPPAAAVNLDVLPSPVAMPVPVSVV